MNTDKNHHFRVVQWPINLLETGAVTEKNQPDGSSALELARAKGLAVLVNRPLNAIVRQGREGDSLTRLADVLPPNYPTNPGEVSTAVTHTITLEEQFHNSIRPAIDTDDETKKQLQEYLAVGLMLQGRWSSFGTYQNWRDVHGRFLLPRLQNAVNFLASLPQPPPDLAGWLDNYVAAANEVLAAVGAFYQAQSAAEIQVMKGTAVLAEPDWQADTLSQIAIRALRSTAGISSVLVGMRRRAYVDDVLQELARPVEIKDRAGAWEKLRET
jgi:aryl-alcohol dehydrogenase-like predicted oxidoreductase